MKITVFLANLVLLCDTLRESDGSKASDILSSYAVHLLKESSVLFKAKHYLRLTQRSQQFKTFQKNEFCSKFRGFRMLEEHKY